LIIEYTPLAWKVGVHCSSKFPACLIEIIRFVTKPLKFAGIVGGKSNEIRDDTIEIFGGIIVTAGIILEFACIFLQHGAALEVRTANSRLQTILDNEATEAKDALAKAGVTIGALSGNLDEMRERLSQTEKAIEELRKSPALPPPTPPPPSPSTGMYALTGDAKRAIRETTLSGAIVSIIPFMPNLEPFASALGNAFAAVPGVQVAVGHGNFIMNGQVGLIVQYDHANPVSASVFNALVKAGLNPIDGPATPDTSIVFIKVAPKP